MMDGKSDVFLTNLSLVIELQPSLYNIDHQHIILLISVLTGQAMKWAMADLRADANSSCSYLEFTQLLRATFNHPESEVGTDSQLYHLWQRDRCLSFYAEFHTLALHTALL